MVLRSVPEVQASKRLDATDPVLVLVVDDDQSAREQLCMACSALGCRVLPAGDCATACAVAADDTGAVRVILVREHLCTEAEMTRLAALRYASAGHAARVIVIARGLNGVTAVLDENIDDVLIFPCAQRELELRLTVALRGQAVRGAAPGHAPMRVNVDAQTVTAFARAVYGRNLKHQAIRTVFRPLELFSGDLYLAARTPAGGMLVLLGDLTGHGLSAALFALPVANIFHERVAAGCDASAVLAAIDTHLRAPTTTGVFMALQCIEFRAGSDTVSVANCAMQKLWLLGPDLELQAVESNSVAAGVDGALFMRTGMRELRVAPGTRILLASDGLTEACNPSGAMFGDRRVQSALCMAAAQGLPLLDELLPDFDRFTAGAAVQDDFSVVEIHCAATLFASMD